MSIILNIKRRFVNFYLLYLLLAILSIIIETFILFQNLSVITDTFPFFLNLSVITDKTAYLKYSLKNGETSLSFPYRLLG